jgi:hypothetical protein
MLQSLFLYFWPKQEICTVFVFIEVSLCQGLGFILQGIRNPGKENKYDKFNLTIGPQKLRIGFVSIQLDVKLDQNEIWNVKQVNNKTHSAEGSSHVVTTAISPVIFTICSIEIVITIAITVPSRWCALQTFTILIVYTNIKLCYENNNK